MPNYAQPSSYPPYSAIPPVEPLVPGPARFPVAAIWLIGFGTLFLLSTTGLFRWVNAYSLVGFGLLGLAAWNFLRCYLKAPAYVAGTDQALQRLVRALRSSIWIALTGVLIILDAFHILGWGRSWPLFIVTPGVIALLDRAAGSPRYRQGPVQPVAEAAPAVDPFAAAPRPGSNGDWNHTADTAGPASPAARQGER